MGRPKKALGQHFLVNQEVAEKILALAGLPAAYENTPRRHDATRDTTFVEVGPGHGMLTKGLAKRARRVIAIEIDASCVTSLRNRLGRHTTLDIVHADALSFAYETIPGTIAVVSNLPYYLATPLLFQFLALRTKVSHLTLMFQKELADRITAVPGTKAYGRLSIAVQLYTEATAAFTVPPSCFIPPPSVDSAVVSLQVRSKPKIAVDNDAYFLDVVWRAFAYRRKTLAGALCQGGIDKRDVLEALSASRISPTRRADTLTIDEFASLAHAFACRSFPVSLGTKRSRFP